MLKFVIKRLLMMVPVLLALTLFIYLIMSLSPGDPAMLILGADAPLADLEALRAEMGLDQSVFVQWAIYIGNVLRGDFGVSWFNHFNILDEFVSRLPVTATLNLVALAISTLVAIPLGIVAAIRQNRPFDYATMVGAMVFASMPTFWFGMMAQLIFCLNLGWFPATGVGSFAHYILPAITLSAVQLAGKVRLTRTLTLETIGQDYVRTARAKGASEFRVITRHVLRNSMVQIVTSIGMTFAMLIGGASVAETVYSLPGIGTLLVNAVKMRDIPVVLGVMIIIATFVGIVNLLVDLLYAVIDPRVKAGYSV